MLFVSDGRMGGPPSFVVGWVDLQVLFDRRVGRLLSDVSDKKVGRPSSFVGSCIKFRMLISMFIE